MRVKKAIVLAAGLGSRLRPFTCATPKPLMPVWGESMLARTVAFLRSLGVSDIAVNCHYLHEQIEKWCAENGCRTSYEPEVLGTAGVLNPLKEWIGEDDFYLVNGDIILEGFEGFKNFKGFDETTIGLCLATEEGPRTIEIEPESGYVTNWRSDDAGYSGTYTYCGFAIYSPRIFDYVKPSGFSSLVTTLETAMMDGKFVKAVVPKDLLWEDCGTIEKYVDVNQDGDDNAFDAIAQLKATGARDFKFLSSRGSERVFFSSDKGIVVIYDDATRKENALYSGHAKWLKAHGAPVPEVVFDDPALKTSVYEYAGAEKKMSLPEQAEVIEALVKFNRLTDAPNLLPPFDAATWAWERELFTEHCLKSRFAHEMPEKVEEELKRVAEVLEKEPKALVHRDFQSTNVLWKNGKLTIIDFQGMRLGPAVYDLASFVYDPYVKISEKNREALVRLYAQKAGRPEIEETLPFAAVQRLVQCLGAYGRLVSVGKREFGKFVEPALVNLLAAADAAGLDAVGALAEDLLGHL